MRGKSIMLPLFVVILGSLLGLAVASVGLRVVLRVLEPGSMKRLERSRKSS